MPGAGANLTWPKTNSAPGLRTYRAVQNRGGFATLYILIQYLGSEVPVPYVKQKTIFSYSFLSENSRSYRSMFLSKIFFNTTLTDNYLSI